jgi:uncharacterized membrane protein
MIATRDIVITIILTLLLFFLSFFYVQFLTEEKEDFFTVSKTYGFPMTVLSISTSSSQLASSGDYIEKENSELFNSGWNLNAGTEKVNLVLAVAVNFVFWLIFSSIFVGLFNAILFNFIKKTRKEDYY